MARDFVNTSGGTAVDYLEYAGAVISGYPCTLAGWFYPNTLTAANEIVAVRNGSTYLDAFRLLYVGSAAGDPVRAVCRQGASEQGTDSTSGVSVANVWYHAAAVFASATSRSIYFNGGSKATGTTNLTPSGLSVTNIGAISSSGGVRANAMDGAIADVGVWNVALSDSDVAALAAGARVATIRLDKLVANWRLSGSDSATANEIDIVGRLTMLQTGAPPLFSDPPLYRQRRRSVWIPAAAGGTAVPVFYHHYQQARMS